MLAEHLGVDVSGRACLVEHWGICWWSIWQAMVGHLGIALVMRSTCHLPSGIWQMLLEHLPIVCLVEYLLVAHLGIYDLLCLCSRVSGRACNTLC